MNKPSKKICFYQKLHSTLFEFSIQDVLQICNEHNILDFENVRINSYNDGEIVISYEKEIDNPNFDQEMDAYLEFLGTSRLQEEQRKHEAKIKEDSLLAKKQWKQEQSKLREMKHAEK